MLLPHEHEPEFIRANAKVQERFIEATHLTYRTGQTRLPACCAKLRGMAELHRYFLKSRFPVPSDRREYLRAAIHQEACNLFATAGHDYPELQAYRDTLLREMLGDAEEERGNANPANSAFVDQVEAEARSVKPIEPSIGSPHLL